MSVKRLVAAVTLAALAGAGAQWAHRTSAIATRARALARRAIGYPAWRQRASVQLDEPPFQHLATSQLGYAPGMRKLFTSPHRFSTFRVLDERDGRIALVGGPPTRELRTDLLGTIDEVWIGDFSALSTPGRYRVALDDGLASHPFDVRADAFDAAIRAVQRALYYQRSFTEIDAAHAEGPWSHPSDASRAPPGVVKGWHDAGDFSLYSLSTASTLFWLLESYSDFAPGADDTRIPESGNGVPDLLDEARWGLEWMLSVQDASGGFRNTTCAERYGPYGTNRPEHAPPYRSGEVGTLATARAVGTLAHAAAVFRPHDDRFADRCLRAARRGHTYLEMHEGEDTDGPTCPAFRQDGNPQVGHDVRMYAAAGMLLATGEARFRREFEAHFQELSNDPSGYRTNWYAALLYLRAPAGDPARKEAIRDRIRAHAALARRDGDAHPFQWAGRYFWGSIGAGFQRSGAFSSRLCLADRSGAAPDCDQALANVHYALGRNLPQICYVSGLPGVTRGRSRAFHQWLAALRAQPFLFPGLVAGGPVRAPEAMDVSYPQARPIPIWGYWRDPAMPRAPATPVDSRYADNDSWSTNEIDIEWQAVTLYGLYFAQWWARQGRG